MDDKKGKKVITWTKNCFHRIFSRLNHPSCIYVILFIAVTIFVLIISSSSVRRSFLSSTFCHGNQKTKRCSNIVGHGGVCRFYMAHALYHLVLAIATSGVCISRKWREKIHGEFWSIKIVLLSLLVLVCLVVPSGTIFDKVLSYVGFVCGLVFIVIQMLIILGITERWLCSLHTDGNSPDEKSWTTSRFLLYHSFIFILYLFSLLLFVYFFLLFGNPPSCQTNIVFLSYVLSHCLIIVMVTFIPRIRKEHSQTGIPKSLGCVLYIIFVTWLAMSSSAQVACNPYAKGAGAEYPGINGTNFVSFVILAVFALSEIKDISVLGQSLERSTKGRSSKQFDTTPIKETNDENLEEDETDQSLYNCSMFHLIMILLSFYVMSVVTNWSEPVAGHVLFRKSRTAMFFLMVATVVCLWLFSWVLVKPVALDFFSNRSNTNASKNSNHKTVGLQELEPANITTRASPLHESDVINASDNPFHKGANKVETFCDLRNNIAQIKKDLDNSQLDKNLQLTEREKEMIRLQEKVLRLQEKIGKLQYKVSVLQGVNL